MDKLEFKVFDKRYENVPEPIGTGASEIDEKRFEFIKQNAGVYQPEVLEMPIVPGLRTYKGGRLPVTREWFKGVCSYGLDGNLNVWTTRMNKKLVYWMFFPTLFWGIHFFNFFNNLILTCIGLTAMATQGIYIENEYRNYEPMEQGDTYDKLSVRYLPYARVWMRPG